MIFAKGGTQNPEISKTSARFARRNVDFLKILNDFRKNRNPKLHKSGALHAPKCWFPKVFHWLSRKDVPKLPKNRRASRAETLLSLRISNGFRKRWYPKSRKPARFARAKNNNLQATVGPTPPPPNMNWSAPKAIFLSVLGRWIHQKSMREGGKKKSSCGTRYI